MNYLNILPQPFKNFFVKPVEKKYTIYEIFIKKIKELVIGILALFIIIPLTSLSGRFVINIMERSGIRFSKGQEIIQILDSIKKIKFSLVKRIIQASMIGYITVLGPFIEELMFRKHLFSWIKDIQKDNNSLFAKISRVTLNGLIFGLCHLSASQGWYNIPIFVVASIAGLIFALLREYSGNIIPSTTTHILYNSSIMIGRSFSVQP